jgi:hypothetical protein
VDAGGKQANVFFLIANEIYFSVMAVIGVE